MSLDDDTERIEAQSVRGIRVTPEDVVCAFEDWVLDSTTLDQLGVAATSGRGIFLYGPTGNGKTSIAETLPADSSGRRVGPHAVEVDGQIITLYDPVVHQRSTTTPSSTPAGCRCRRPCIIVGGELIRACSSSVGSRPGIYAAPLQMKANNGILIIDDFGRQLMSPRDLLNRWIVPLDRQVDYLTLAAA